MKLLVADDHTLFRDALLEYIERADPDASVKMARDLHEVMEIMDGDPSLDLILMDLKMPGMNGLQGLSKLRATYPDAPIALMSGVAEKYQVEEAINMGVVGYFPKTMSGKALLKGIEKVLAGEKYYATDHNQNELMPAYYNGGGFSQPGMAETQAAFNAGEVRLTPRETEVLGYLMKGSSNKEIARVLDLQVVTVKLHVRGICRKLDAKNRTQAALKARELGLYGMG